MNITEFIFFSAFLVFILLVLLLDLGVFNRRSHIIPFREALIWSIVWISLGLAFYFFILHFGHWVHGIETLDDISTRIGRYGHPIRIEGLSFEEALSVYRNNLALEYLTGYLIEKSLSVDNIFVMIMIFMAFGTAEKYYKRVLFWGILGALVLRFIFIFAGAALVNHFHPILWLFGAFLIVTGIKMYLDRNNPPRIDPGSHPMVRFASKWFRLHPEYVGQKFFFLHKGKWMITPLFLVLLVIEFSDVIFAVDSIPAIFAVTTDPYIIFFSNVFAILGLRALFFLVASVIHRFRFLKVGLAILLTGIGLKMILPELIEIIFDIHIRIPTQVFLFFVLIILGGSILLSVLLPAKDTIPGEQ
ncbi:MAG: TerC/Alx family metal homeostasis membrane protein [Bacteroidales bacterium]|nr:TerC/Alx family metal homeostasis membrane protein [Bacteroidales bacterium]